MAYVGQSQKRRLAEEEAPGIHWRLHEFHILTNYDLVCDTPNAEIRGHLYVLITVPKVGIHRLSDPRTCTGICT